MEKEIKSDTTAQGTKTQHHITKRKTPHKYSFFLVIAITLLVTTTGTAVWLARQTTELSSKANTTGITIPVLEDTHVSQSSTDKNYGDKNENKIDEDKITYLKFNLAQLANKPLTKATLRLYITNDSKDTQTIKEVVASNWTELAINATNKPAVGPRTIASISDTKKNTWKDIDITNYVAENAGKVISFAIDATPENNNNLYISSKESSNAPVIVIETANTAVTIPSVSPTAFTQPTAAATATQPPVQQPSPTTTVVIPTTPPLSSGGARTITVATAAQLTAALADAKPGDVITMADGTYKTKSASVVIGKQNVSAAFRLSQSGTSALPIILQGTRKALIDGDNDYGLHLFNANYIQLKGFTVFNAKKGIMLDGSNHNILDGVEVRNIRDEGVHFRSFSSDNVIRNSYVHHTGEDKRTGALDNGYGEGIYVGSANSNWATYTGGKIDESNRNYILGNTVSYTAGEGIDIKEGTKDGIIRGNTFDNAGIAGTNFADSWVDIKGNNWLITENKGSNALLDGYQIHGVYPGWGNKNTFTYNTISNVKGNGFWVQNNVTGNIISCNNTVTSATKGFANVPCSK
ncbi:MAG: right-handed parallel beta-helix repeat-containing protein [Patescibacteria group bacterium]